MSERPHRRPEQPQQRLNVDHWASGNRTPEPDGVHLRPREADRENGERGESVQKRTPRHGWGCRRRGKQRALAMWPRTLIDRDRATSTRSSRPGAERQEPPRDPAAHGRRQNMRSHPTPQEPLTRATHRQASETPRSAEARLQLIQRPGLAGPQTGQTDASPGVQGLELVCADHGEGGSALRASVNPSPTDPADPHLSWGRSAAHTGASTGAETAVSQPRALR